MADENSLESLLNTTPTEPTAQTQNKESAGEDEFKSLLDDFLGNINTEPSAPQPAPQPQPRVETLETIQNLTLDAEFNTPQESAIPPAATPAAPINTATETLSDSLDNFASAAPTQDISLDDMQSSTLDNQNFQELAETLDNIMSASENNAPSTDGLDDMIQSAPAPSTGGLDDMIQSAPAPSTGGLDDMIQSAPNSTSDGLDGMITNAPSASEGLDSFATTAPASGALDGMISQPSEDSEKEQGGLKPEEQELARAVANFKDGITVMASRKKLKLPQTDYTEDMLIPNYKPSVGKKIAQYLINGWDIVNKYDPESMKQLSPTATDEEYLTFAEGLRDNYLQLTVISYVEILINIEICEVSYEQKKELMMKNKVKKELYEEYLALQERKNLFIQKLKEKNFPIDVDRLMNNYFRAAQKDADGAFEALTKNPAMFAPIEVEKLRPKFFGLIKVTPEDGIKANKKIGEFIKNLKV